MKRNATAMWAQIPPEGRKTAATHVVEWRPGVIPRQLGPSESNRSLTDFYVQGSRKLRKPEPSVTADAAPPSRCSGTGLPQRPRWK